MCLITIALNVHSEYPLILAANRDEFYNRPTTPLAFWEDNGEILAGRDLQSQGTWLGVTRKGRIAAVTNYRDPHSMTPWGKSRGQLVRDYLAGRDKPADYLAAVEKEKDQYSGFNLIVGDAWQLWWYSNKNGGVVKLSPGIHGISNHLLNTPWPKVEKAKQKLAGLIQTNLQLNPETLLDMLHDRNRPPDENLPNTGVGLQWERMLSPMFIASSIYGTRSSSAIIADKTGKLIICERTFEPDKEEPTPNDTRCFEIELA